MRMNKSYILLLFISIFISAMGISIAGATDETNTYKDLSILDRNQQITSNRVSEWDAINFGLLASSNLKMIDDQIGASPSTSLPDGYPLVEEFNAPEVFTSTDADVYIGDGKVNWTIYRNEGEQYVYRSIPPFSGDVRLIVRGQIESATDNCGVKVGIGNALDSGIEVIFGFAGGGCATNGYLIDARGVSLDHSFVDCNFIGDWLWVDSGTQYTATLTIQEDSVDLSVPSVGSISGTPVFTDTYETLYIGNTGDGALPSCAGTIESVVIEPITFCESVSELPTSECEALLTIYSNTDGDNWLDNTGWLQTDTPCSTPWYGVTCSEGHVTQLDLSENQLVGSIPSQLGDLAMLEQLDLASNHLSGNIPSALGMLTNLEGMQVAYNQFSGEIPAEMVNLSALSSADLGYNMLTSTNPVLLAYLADKDPDWADTQTVPPGNVQVVEVMTDTIGLTWTPITYTMDGGYYEISYALTSGGSTIVHGTTSDKSASGYAVDGLTPFTEYYFVVRTYTPAHDEQQNELMSANSEEAYAKTLSTVFCENVSELPTTECEALLSLYSYTDGEHWLDNTGWWETYTPCSTPWYGVTCSDGHVNQIDLVNNQLTGTIPQDIGNFSGLQYLYLNGNQLSGSIPPQIGSLNNLKYLYLYSNQLDGGISPELGNLSSLQYLSLSSNQLGGSIPMELGKLSNLRNLYLYSNQLNGSIPPEIGDLSNLLYLSLSDNQLGGSIPPELGFLSKLENLYLYNNQIGGEIPPEAQ